MLTRSSTHPYHASNRKRGARFDPSGRVFFLGLRRARVVNESESIFMHTLRLFVSGWAVRGARVLVLPGADCHAGHHRQTFLAAQLHMAAGIVCTDRQYIRCMYVPGFIALVGPLCSLLLGPFGHFLVGVLAGVFALTYPDIHRRGAGWLLVPEAGVL